MAMLLSTCIVTIVVPARAQTADFAMHGQLRYRHVQLSDFSLDETGFMHGDELMGTMRLRLKPSVHFSKDFFVKADLQLLGGRVYGDRSSLGGQGMRESYGPRPMLEQLKLREGYVQIPIVLGDLRLGRMISDWGMGLYANGGGRERYSFADAADGDLMNRVLFVLKPFAFVDAGRIAQAFRLVLGADLVEQDEMTQRREGDMAWQVIGALAWREPRLKFGVYVAYRDLERESGERNRQVTTDVHVRWQDVVAGRYRYRLEMEAVLIEGDRLAATGGAVTEISQFGLAGQARFWDEEIHLEAMLRAGYGSGDSDGHDGIHSAFRFDPGHRVGMILFEEVMARLSARSYDRVMASPNAADVASGWDHTPTQGAVQGAAYINPEIAYTACEGCFSTRLGFLMAFASSAVQDGSKLGEGAVNHFGQREPGGILGYELNADCSFGVRVDRSTSVKLAAQYGLFIAGEALAAADGAQGIDTVHKVRIMTDVRW